MHGHSIKGLIEGKKTKIRDAVIYGWHGKAVNIFDGRYTYFRGPDSDENQPCFSYCAIPTTLWRYMGKSCMDKIEMGRFLSYTDFPVFKIPRTQKDNIMGDIMNVRNSLLFDNKIDYQQQHPLNDQKLETRMIKKLIKAMKNAQAPSEQYERLGIKDIYNTK